jgi:uncharacterized protein YebE (UPF0316 family)
MELDMLEMVVPALSIFALRVVDVSLYTMRLMMVMRGRKLLAWLFALFQSVVFVTALRAIMSDLGNWVKIVGYAAGFATGLVVGMAVEGRLGIGNTHLSIISPRRGQELAKELRGSGFGVTELPGKGKDGVVDVLLCDVRRRDVPAVHKIAQRVDSEAFITSGILRMVLGGYWRK